MKLPSKDFEFPGDTIEGPMPVSEKHNQEQNMDASMKGFTSSNLEQGFSDDRALRERHIGAFDYVPFF